MLPHLFLCRHGETAWNAERRIQGQVDVPLNALGRRQAARNGTLLRERLGAGAPGWDFLASPLARTRETMEIIREALGLPLGGYPTDARLMELNFGDWQGSTLAEIERRTPEALAERERDKWNYVPPGAGAESYAMLARRMAPVFAALARPTIVVAHGGIARCFLVRHAGLAPAEAAHAPIAQDRIIETRDGVVAWV
ncbi:phosphoglycerate mutase [Aureimonas endophytica]|uniref:Phosphoglycerate mutase n=1 Tax=Aureimonas endophytica TaxID=2027858 RepID=A0A916ZUH1_9HYPH|nr:histidine phosphatase family protein [Aureimonas endophytica]GGE14479.1 phosphoglycerate mutase [Aureimonas endophytica]